MTSNCPIFVKTRRMIISPFIIFATKFGSLSPKSIVFLVENQYLGRFKAIKISQFAKFPLLRKIIDVWYTIYTIYQTSMEKMLKSVWLMQLSWNLDRIITMTLGGHFSKFSHLSKCQIRHFVQKRYLNWSDFVLTLRNVFFLFFLLAPGSMRNY